MCHFHRHVGHSIVHRVLFGLILASQSAIFQSYRDGVSTSLVLHLLITWDTWHGVKSPG